jgi:hypothetical protein
MKIITVLRDDGQGINERCEIAIERCSSSTGWGVVDRYHHITPINDERTLLIGWGNESGAAAMCGKYKIALDKLA